MTQNESFRDNLKSALSPIFLLGRQRYFYEAVSLQETGSLYLVYF